MKSSSPRKVVKAPTDDAEQTLAGGFSNEKRPIDRNPKLKKLVADFKKAHQAFSDNLLKATYRLIHDARRIGDLLLKMQREGGFKSKRQLHVWLELQAEISIPQPTFYRYIQAAEDFQKVEVIHGTTMLKEITSNKVLKMLANPRVEPLPAAEEEATGGPSAGPTAGKVAAVSPSQDASPPHARKSRNGMKAVARPEAGDETSGQAGVSREHQKRTAANDEPEPPPPAIHITTGCKRFRIETDNRLTCLDGNGHLITLVAEKKDLAKQLKEALADWEGGQ
jgi:hypothetical protein